MHTTAHTGTTTTAVKLTGRRFTAIDPRWSTPEVGQVLFCEKVGGEYQLGHYPGRLNMSQEIGERGDWLGSFNGIAAYQTGRVAVVAKLKWDDERDINRFAVRFLDETDDEYMEAAKAAEGARS